MAAASEVQLGIDGAVYRNAGSYMTPTWTEIDLVRNVTPAVKWDRGDSSSRATKAKLQAKTQVAISGTIECRADPADAGYQALFDASQEDSTGALDLMILDADITTEGARGVRGFMNLDFAQNQGVGDVIYTTFEYDPAWNVGGYPASVVMGATSTPTLTTF